MSLRFRLAFCYSYYLLQSYKRLNKRLKTYKMLRKMGPVAKLVKATVSYTVDREFESRWDLCLSILLLVLGEKTG